MIYQLFSLFLGLFLFAVGVLWLATLSSLPYSRGWERAVWGSWDSVLLGGLTFTVIALALFFSFSRSAAGEISPLAPHIAAHEYNDPDYFPASQSTDEDLVRFWFDQANVAVFVTKVGDCNSPYSTTCQVSVWPVEKKHIGAISFSVAGNARALIRDWGWKVTAPTRDEAFELLWLQMKRSHPPTLAIPQADDSEVWCWPGFVSETGWC